MDENNEQVVDTIETLDTEVAETSNVEDEGPTFDDLAKEKLAIEDENDPLNQKSLENISKMLENSQMLVQIMQSQWEASARELSLNDKHMRMLAAVNDKYKENPPEHLTQEQLEEWDYLNGIDKITDEDIDEIFEEGHPVRGVDHSQTVDRIKGACKDFYGWLQTMRYYRQLHDAFLELNELEEEKNLNELREVADKEEDPDKKAEMLKSIDLYYNRKYLDFLAEPLPDEDRERIIAALDDEKKIKYWIDRCRQKLDSLKISSKFILEVSKFEKRFLEEKYHGNSNVFLVYFMMTSIYSDTGDKKSDGRTKVVSMVMALDAVIRNTWKEDKRDRVLDNIRKFEDQFLGKVPVNELTNPTAEEPTTSEE